MPQTATDWTLSLTRAIRDGNQDIMSQLFDHYLERSNGPTTPESFQWTEQVKSMISRSANRQLKALCKERLQLDLTPRSRGASTSNSPLNSPLASPVCGAAHTSPAGMPSSVCTRAKPAPERAPESPKAVLCFQGADGQFRPASDLIAAKKTELRTLLERADGTVKKLTGDVKASVNARDSAEQQAAQLQKTIRDQCSELRNTVDAQEGMLMTKLQAIQKAYTDELMDQAHETQDYVVRLNDLCQTMSQLLDHEKDPNVFMAQITLPELELNSLLQQDLGAVDPSPLGLQLDTTSALKQLQLLDLFKPQIAPKTEPATALLPEAKVAYKFSIVLDLLLSQWLSERLLQTSIRAMTAAHAGVPTEACRVLSVQSGSTVVEFEVVASETVASTVLQNLERLFSAVQDGGFHLHGVKVLTMSAPVRLLQPSSEIPIDDQLDAIIAANHSPVPVAVASEGSGPKSKIEELQGAASGSVVQVEELWNNTKDVSLCVREHASSVSFVGSNFGRCSVEIVVRCTGINLEPFDTCITLAPGLHGCTLGQALVLDQKRAWTFEYTWSVHSGELPQAMPGVAMSELKAELEKTLDDKTRAVAEEEFVLAAKLHTRCKQLQQRVDELGSLPKLEELQKDLETLKAQKQEQVSAEAYDLAAITKEKIEQLEKMIGSAVVD